jgi:hypothetical protein
MDIIETKFQNKVGIEWTCYSTITVKDIMSLIDKLKGKNVFIHKMDNTFNKRTLSNLEIKDTKLLDYYLQMIINNNEPIQEIQAELSYQRFNIYVICNVLGYKYENIVENISKIEIQRNTELEYDSDNDYDIIEPIKRVRIPRTYKIGVRIYKNL